MPGRGAKWTELIQTRDLRYWARLHGAVDLGLNGVFGLDAGVTSDPFYVVGGSQFNLGFDFVHASATELRFLFERGRTESGPWRLAPTNQISSGFATMNDLVYRRPVSGDDAQSINFPISEVWMRVTIIGLGAHPTNDQITCDAVVRAGLG